MATDPHTRPIPAPAQEWLTRKEVCNALDLGEKFIDKLIREGKFPRGTKWDGKELRWPWWVVVWFRYQKALEPLFRAGSLDDDESDDETELKAPRK